MNAEITIPLERYDELIRAETLLHYKMGYEKSNKIEKNKGLVLSADNELKNIIRKTIQYCQRKGDSYYNGDELAATIKGNRIYFRLVALEEYIENFMNSRSLLLNLTDSVVELNPTDGKTGHSLHVVGKFGSHNYKMIKIKSEVIEELGLFNEVFKHDKIDRDKFLRR